MENLGYDWTNSPTGQYVDGHELVDVVDYRQNVFLPAWFAKEPQLHVWLEGTKDGPGNMHQLAHASPLDRPLLSGIMTRASSTLMTVVSAGGSQSLKTQYLDQKGKDTL